MRPRSSMQIVERAKTEAAERAIAAERERAHGREIELAAASHVREHARLRRIAIALSLGIAAVLLGGALVDATVLTPHWERRIAAASADDVARRDHRGTSGEARVARRGDGCGAQRARSGRVDRRSSKPSSPRHDARFDKLRRPRSTSIPPAAPPPETGFSTKCPPDSLDPLCANLGR